MKSSVKDLSKTRKKISIEASKEEVVHAYDHAYKQVGKKTTLKGFRKGKIPKDALDKFYAPDIYNESLKHLVSHTYPKALEEHKLTPLLKPQFKTEPLEPEHFYRYEVEIEVKPAFEVKKYKGVPLKKRVAEVTDEELKMELDHLRESKAELKPAEGERALKQGLVGTIDFVGMIDGKPFQGGSAKGYILEYGKSRLLKEFEGQLEGLPLGESREVTITFPADYFNELLRNQRAAFRVTLQALHTKELPVLDDEFAKDLGKDSMEVVTNEIKDMVSKRKETSFRREYGKEVTEYLLKHHSFEVPQGLVEEELKYNNKKQRAEVEDSIRLQFILEQIAQAESIKLEPRELEGHFQKMARMANRPVATLKQVYRDPSMLSGLVAQLTFEKTLDFVIDQATLK